jgi:hypothetical protein
MLDNTRSPLRIKCQQNTMFHSIEIVRQGRRRDCGDFSLCDHCDVLTAKNIAEDSIDNGRA